MTTTMSINDFTLAKIQECEPQIERVDVDDTNNLSLYCYNECDEQTPRFVQECRGLVFHDDKLIMKAFSYAPEYSFSNEEKLKSVLDDFANWTFFKSYEGTLLRMFFFAGRWYLSTHRRLNAFTSRWSSRKSFGESLVHALELEEANNPKYKEFLSQFVGMPLSTSLPTHEMNALERFQEHLDKEKQYMFLLRNNKDNRVVCDAPTKDLVMQVGTFENFVLSLDFSILPLPHPEKLEFKNFDELKASNLWNDYSAHQGIIAIHTNGNQIKIFSDEYQKFSKVRGNEPNLVRRYLQIRGDEEQVADFLKLYPKMESVIERVERAIYELAGVLHKKYLERYANQDRRFVELPPSHHAIVSICHTWYLKTRAETNGKVRVLPKTVLDILNKQETHHLFGLVNTFLKNQGESFGLEEENEEKEQAAEEEKM